MTADIASDAERNDKQAARLRALVDPRHTALLTMEMQNGIVVDGGTLPALANEVRRSGIIPAIGSLCTAARAAGVRVVHCTALTRPDGAGAVANCKIFALSEKQRIEGVNPVLVGSHGAKLVPEIGDDPRDIEVPRLHGMSPFTNTAVDQILRNLGIKTVIVTGVSVDLGIFGTSMTALDNGYQVVIPRNCVTGLPYEYAQSVLDNSLAYIATITSAEAITAAWSS
jgi:biuret amidohydrolase